MVEIRFINEDEVPGYRQGLARGFGYDIQDEAEDLERFHVITKVETTIAAFDRGHVVATFSSYDLDLTVPGGSIEAAGTTQVTVHPTHRRRGILTEMMTMHLQQAIDRGQPMATLWASEDRIYGRFGYGVACYGTELAMPSRAVTLPPASADLSFRFLTDVEARTTLPPIYDRVRPTTPGFFVRGEAWWEHRVFGESDHSAKGASRQRFVIVERNGEPVGYVIYRQRRAPSDFEEGQTEISELLAIDDDARRALWHFITNVDLYRNVTWWNAPIDEPLFLEADRFRMIERTTFDTMWLRPLDVPRVLESRRYEHDGIVVLEVNDPFFGRGGRFLLEVSDGEGSCSPTEREAQVELDISDLGSAYFGGLSVDALARAGRVVGPPQAVRVMNEIFRTTRAPYCIEVF